MGGSRVAHGCFKASRWLAAFAVEACNSRLLNSCLFLEAKPRHSANSSGTVKVRLPAGINLCLATPAVDLQHMNGIACTGLDNPFPKGNKKKPKHPEMLGSAGSCRGPCDLEPRRFGLAGLQLEGNKDGFGGKWES